MPKILIPSLSQARKESFAKRGIHLIEAATVEEAVDMLCNAALPPNHQYSDDSFKIVDMINSGSSNADNFLDSNLGWNK